MDLLEADNIDLYKESKHWWIKTRFLYIDKVIESLEHDNNEINILEVGCGTGQNIAYIRNDYKGTRKVRSIYGVDINLPKGFTRNDLGEHDIMSAVSPPENIKYDILIMMDVVEHVENPVDLISNYSKYLKHDGRVLITVPAFNHLWSRHDVILEHIKRYKRNVLNEESIKAGLSPVFTKYIFSVFYFIVLFVRKVLPESKSVSTDLKLPHSVLNRLFYIIGLVEYKLSFIRLPFGTSVVGIYKKN